MTLIKHGKNIHQLNVEGKHFQIAMLSDIHWDNPKCDWDYLKKHLDYCLENNILIHINGDMFCLMQGRGDNRRNKSDIRPEHNNAKYLDSIVETAVEWWSPYAHLLTVIGYGNHETGIIKYQETDILQRFVDLLNYKNKTNVHTGGYGGWLIINQMYRNNCRQTSRIKYFHGSGGGGVVTKGALNLTRALEMYEDFDVFTMGHIHENSSRNDVREMIKYHSQKGYEIKHKDIHLMLTGTYKEEYGDGSHGWHVERGAPVKPVGGRILDIRCDEYEKDKKTFITKIVDSRKFPI
jgi:hypothetical protein